MNKAVKNISNCGRIYYDVSRGVSTINLLAYETDQWVEKNPCPIPTGAKWASESDCKKWWINKFESKLDKAVKFGKVSDKIVLAYLKSCFAWVGLRHGFQFQYPNAYEVYGRYLCM